MKPHAAAQHLVKRRNRAGQDGVEISVENHGRQLPDPFKQNAAQPFRQVKKGYAQIDLFLLPAGNRFDIAADNKWNQHPEESCYNAGKQHEPEVQRIFHFCFYVLFLHFQKYLYHFSLLQLSGFVDVFVEQSMQRQKNADPEELDGVYLEQGNVQILAQQAAQLDEEDAQQERGRHAGQE